jgi:hypothetical protein
MIEKTFLLIEGTDDLNKYEQLYAGKGQINVWKDKMDCQPHHKVYRLTEIERKGNKATIAQCHLHRDENYDWPNTGSNVINSTLDKRTLGFLEMVADAIRE